jgi:hypothetical protein
VIETDHKNHLYLHSAASMKLWPSAAFFGLDFDLVFGMFILD